MKAAAINSSDIGYVARRFKKTPPRTPGQDSEGIVITGNHPEGAEVWAVLRRSVSSMTVLMRNMAAIGVPYITAWASVVTQLKSRPVKPF